MPDLQQITIRWQPLDVTTRHPFEGIGLNAQAVIQRKLGSNPQEIWDGSTGSWVPADAIPADYTPLRFSYVSGAYQAVWVGGEIGEYYSAELGDADGYAVQEIVTWQHPHLRLICPGTSVVLPILPTADEVIVEGQLKHEYFPMLAPGGTVPELDAALDAFCEEKAAAAAVHVRRQVGAHYDSADADVIAELHRCILFVTLARVWQIILNVMTAYDEESLPPEFVDPSAAERIRDYYERSALEILVQYDASPGASSYAGAFDSGGSKPGHGILGVGY